MRARACRLGQQPRTCRRLPSAKAAAIPLKLPLSESLSLFFGIVAPASHDHLRDEVPKLGGELRPSLEEERKCQIAPVCRGGSMAADLDDKEVEAIMLPEMVDAANTDVSDDVVPLE